MQLEIANRKKAKIKLCLQGASGSGKTMSALLIAFGITNDWSRIAIVDAENRSSDLYAHLGPFNVLPFDQPHSPDRYVKAMDVCLQHEIEVIIFDGISPCWEFLLDYHSSLAGNSFTNWAKINPLLKQFTDRILQSDVHIIATMRSKQEYVINNIDGKNKVEKLALKGIFRDGIEYDFTMVLDIDCKHNAIATKDRTSLFVGKNDFKITIETGKQILAWCNSGQQPTSTITPAPELEVPMEEQINNCSTMKELIALYGTCSQQRQADFRNHFATRRDELTPAPNPIPNLNPEQQNGHITITTS